MNSLEALDELVAETCQNLKCFKYEQVIKKDLEVLEILKKWIVVNETNDDLFPYEIKVKNGYVSNKSCLVLIEEDYKKIKEWLER